MAALDAQPDAVLVTANYAVIDAAGQIIRTVQRELPPAVAAWRLLFHNHLAAHSLVMLRRDAVERTGGYDERYATAQDYALWLRLMDLGTIVMLPDVLLHLREQPGSVSDLRREEQFANTVRASQKKLRDLTERDLDAAAVERLFGFWAGWQAPDAARIGVFDRRLRAIYRAFCARYEPTATDRRQIRRATAAQYAHWLSQESAPLAELRMSLVAAAWHPLPVLAHGRAHGWRWLSRVRYQLKRR